MYKKLISDLIMVLVEAIVKKKSYRSEIKRAKNVLQAKLRQQIKERIINLSSAMTKWYKTTKQSSPPL